MDIEPPAIIRTQIVHSLSAHRRGAEMERRSARRQRAVYRIAHVETRCDNGLARVVDISDDGVGLKLHMPVMLGDNVTVHLTEHLTVAGRVVWTAGADCGLQLDNPIDSDALLREFGARPRAQAQRPPRIAIDQPAVARSEAGVRKVQVRDVSQHGMKVLHDGSFTEGLRVKVTLSSGTERRGVVRWSSDGIAGLILLEPFTTAELGSAKNL